MMEEIFLKCDRVAASVVVQQYCSFVAIQFIFGQSSSFFVNPVSFGAGQKLTGLAKNKPDCQKQNSITWTVLVYSPDHLVSARKISSFVSITLLRN